MANKLDPTKILAALKASETYCKQKAGLLGGDPVTYEGEELNGVLNIVFAGNGTLTTGFFIDGSDVLNAIAALAHSLHKRCADKESREKLVASLIKLGLEMSVEETESETESKPETEGVKSESQA